MNHKYNLLMFLIILFSPLFHCVLAQNHIFIISSYNKNDLCGKPQYDGIINRLEFSGILEKYKIKSFYLDSKNKEIDKVKKLATQIKQQIKKDHPDLIITIDDIAFDFFAKMLLSNNKIRLVFSGINKSLKEYNDELKFFDPTTYLPTKNITGVHESLFMKNQFEFLYLIYNRIPKVAVLYSTDFIGNILGKQVQEELANSEFINHTVFIPIRTTLDLKNAINKINNKQFDAYIPLTMSITDPVKNEILSINRLIPILTNQINLIDIGVNKEFTKAGFFGGITVDFYKMGQKAGEKVIKILNGKNIKEIKIEESYDYEIVINKKRMKQLNVNINSELINIVDKFY
ncbi:ABC transporter substrate-binding protein [Deferribacter abyssi]|uniref:ABC transporter substrate-binding protein n=1 Tax=Deferribacter abyssi TaxID=213806 RepID=UPI003C1D3A5A